MVMLDYILEMLKKNSVNQHILDEEIIVDLKFMSERTGFKTIVYSGAPLSIRQK